MLNNIGKRIKIFRYLGPGILVTVGFIDPGNWAANLEAGSSYGYALLWMVTLSTIMLIILQHNVAHLGIISGHSLSENTFIHVKPIYAKPILGSALVASISTALAEILGGAIALELLFGIPTKIAAILLMLVVLLMIVFNTYRRLEKIIIGFVSIIGFAFFYETTLLNIDWPLVVKSSVIPSIPAGSLPIVVAVLGAVVMPHNLFIHSEIIQSRKWYLKHESIKKKLLRYEFLDTLFSMIIGFAINIVIIILAAEVFYKNSIVVTDLSQASELLRPLLGNMSGIVFAIALLFAGFASSITAGMSGGIISSAILNKEYNDKSKETRLGVFITLIIATIIIIFISNPLKALIISQIILSMQLPITIFLQIYLTSSKKIMGKHSNALITQILIISCGIFVTILNIVLLITLF